VGTVVRLNRQTDAQAAPRQSLPPDVRSVLAINADRIEQATSACGIVVGCIASLQRSLATLDGLQGALLESALSQPDELQTAAVKSQLSSQLASVAALLMTLGDASEKLSRVGSWVNSHPGQA
jgi:hypothetical protein